MASYMGQLVAPYFISGLQTKTYGHNAKELEKKEYKLFCSFFYKMILYFSDSS